MGIKNDIASDTQKIPFQLTICTEQKKSKLRDDTHSTAFQFHKNLCAIVYQITITTVSLILHTCLLLVNK